MAVIGLAVVVTVLVVFFFIKMQKENRVATAELVISRAWNHQFSRLDIEEKKELYLRNHAKHPIDSEKKAAKKVKQWDKQISKYQKMETAYAEGKCFSLVDCITLFGYQLLTDLKVNAESEIMRDVIRACEYSGYLQLERWQKTGERKNSFIYAYYIIASLFSYIFIGMILGVCMLVVLVSMGRTWSNALVFALAAFGLMFLVGYIPYDSLLLKAQKRQESIDRDFPNVISKIALLAMAGMSIVRAIEETANSGESAIYLELQKVVKEIKQADTLTEALSHMQCRCNNQYLDKMITVISKSSIVGNVNLADHLLAINEECWSDKKHNARRMGEAVQNKLFIPAILMFIGILVVIIVPVMSSLNI